MRFLHAENFGIYPNEDITEKLNAMLESIAEGDENKTLIFKKGDYFIDSLKCKKYMLFITNTVGDKEFSSDEIPHQAEVAFCFNNIKNLIFDGNDSTFFIDGKVTAIAIQNCENITIKNLEIKHNHPDMHEIKVVKITDCFVDFLLDEDTLCDEKDGEYYFYGNGYSHPFMKYSNSGWIGLVKNNNLNHIVRTRHPFHKAQKFEKLSQNLYRVYFEDTSRYDLLDRFYVYEVRREYVGIFIDRSKDIVFENVKQRFNYSLAVVAQDCENITVKNSVFAPEKGSERLVASSADFIQFCMCRGMLSITDNVFEGAGDDCMNVHGVHYIITEIKENAIVVDYCHAQTHGFNPLRTGDEIAFINPQTMLEKAKTSIISSKMINENQIKLVVENAEKARLDYAIEDISACPDVYFANNTLNRIITRGLLLTTRGKVLIENNRFIDCDASGILLSDDANNWYESGMCLDVTIKNNQFDFCGDTPILILPENVIHEGAVHKNIKIIGNKFSDYKGTCIYAKSSDNILIEDNAFQSLDFFDSVNCTNVRISE